MAGRGPVLPSGLPRRRAGDAGTLETPTPPPWRPSGPWPGSAPPRPPTAPSPPTCPTCRRSRTRTPRATWWRPATTTSRRARSTPTRRTGSSSPRASRGSSPSTPSTWSRTCSPSQSSSWPAARPGRCGCPPNCTAAPSPKQLVVEGAPLWIAGAAAHPGPRLWWWGAAALIDLVGTWLAHPLPRRTLSGADLAFDAGHMVERLRLFFIIVLRARPVLGHHRLVLPRHRGRSLDRTPRGGGRVCGSGRRRRLVAAAGLAGRTGCHPGRDGHRPHPRPPAAADPCRLTGVAPETVRTPNQRRVLPLRPHSRSRHQQ